MPQRANPSLLGLVATTNRENTGLGAPSSDAKTTRKIQASESERLTHGILPYTFFRLFDCYCATTKPYLGTVLPQPSSLFVPPRTKPKSFTTQNSSSTALHSLARIQPQQFLPWTDFALRKGDSKVSMALTLLSHVALERYG